jgi:hypothetical protein
MPSHINGSAAGRKQGSASLIDLSCAAQCRVSERF